GVLCLSGLRGVPARAGGARGQGEHAGGEDGRHMSGTPSYCHLHQSPSIQGFMGSWAGISAMVAGDHDMTTLSPGTNRVPNELTATRAVSVSAPATSAVILTSEP